MPKSKDRAHSANATEGWVPQSAPIPLVVLNDYLVATDPRLTSGANGADGGDASDGASPNDADARGGPNGPALASIPPLLQRP